jgi:hypothetical protein
MSSRLKYTYALCVESTTSIGALLPEGLSLAVEKPVVSSLAGMVRPFAPVVSPSAIRHKSGKLRGILIRQRLSVNRVHAS